MTKQEEILRIFSDYMKQRLEHIVAGADKLQEIRMGVGLPVRIKQAGEECLLTGQGWMTRNRQEAWHLSETEMEDVIKNICQYSIYAFEHEISQGFLTVQGGHRVGVAGRVVLGENGQIRNITHIRFLNIRISHEVLGAANDSIPFLYESNTFLNTLLISPPGCGKTTLLRDIVRQVSDGNPSGTGRQVGVVDERSEIAGSYLGIPQNHVGFRTDVLDACPKVQGMMLLMRSMAPAVVAVDEIGGEEDIQAIQQILKGGSSIVATMHGNSIEDAVAYLDGKLVFRRYILLERIQGIPQVTQIYDQNLCRMKYKPEDEKCCG